MVEVTPRYGEVWVARLNPNQGREIGKTRPVVVLQTNAVTEAGLPTVLVAPLTSRLHEGTEPLRVRLAARDRLLKDSFICAEQLRAIDRSRLGEGPLTRLIAQELQTTRRTLRGLLEI